MSCSLDTFERMKAALQEQKKVGRIRSDLYSHLTEVFHRIVQHHKYDAFERFEEISHLIKKTHLKIIDPKRDATANRVPETSKFDQGVKDFVEHCRGLLEERTTVDEEYLDDADQCVISDLSEDFRLFEWAGHHIGEEEVHRL